MWKPNSVATERVKMTLEAKHKNGNSQIHLKKIPTCTHTHVYVCVYVVYVYINNIWGSATKFTICCRNETAIKQLSIMMLLQALWITWIDNGYGTK